MEQSSARRDFFGTVLLTVLLLLFAGFLSGGVTNHAFKTKHAETVAITHADTPALTGQTCNLSPESLRSPTVQHPSEAVSQKWSRINAGRLASLRLSALQRADFLTGPAPFPIYSQQCLHRCPDPDAWPDLG